MFQTGTCSCFVLLSVLVLCAVTANAADSTAQTGGVEKEKPKITSAILIHCDLSNPSCLSTPDDDMLRNWIRNPHGAPSYPSLRFDGSAPISRPTLLRFLSESGAVVFEEILSGPQRDPKYSEALSFHHLMGSNGLRKVITPAHGKNPKDLEDQYKFLQEQAKRQKMHAAEL